MICQGFNLYFLSRFLSWGFLLLGGLSVPVFAQAAEVQSTAVGGQWNLASTWVDGAVPVAGDDVVINGSVDFNVTNNPLLGDLTIVSGAFLSSIRDNQLSVQNFTNEGSLFTTNGGFRMNIGGNMVQNGLFTPASVYFNGSSRQNIAGNSSVGSTAWYLEQSVTFVSDFELQSRLHLQNQVVEILDGQTLTLHRTISPGTIRDIGSATLQLRSSMSGVTLEVDQLIVDSTGFSSSSPLFFQGEIAAETAIRLEGDGSILCSICQFDSPLVALESGTLLIERDSEVRGNLWLAPGTTLTNKVNINVPVASKQHRLTLSGDLLNQGSVTYNNNSFTLEVAGDVDNQGPLRPLSLILNGSTSTELTSTQPIEARVTLARDVLVNSDVSLADTVNLTGHNLVVDGEVDVVSFFSLVGPGSVQAPLSDLKFSGGVSLVDSLVGDRIVLEAPSTGIRLYEQTLQANEIASVGSGTVFCVRCDLMADSTSLASGIFEVEERGSVSGDLMVLSGATLRHKNQTSSLRVRQHIFTVLGSIVNQGSILRIGSTNTFTLLARQNIVNDGGTWSGAISTRIAWEAIVDAVAYQVRFTDSFGVWGAPVDVNATDYVVTDRLTGDWYWQFRPEFTDGSFGDWSGVRFINEPSGHETSVATIGLVESETTWEAMANPVLTFVITSSVDLASVHLSYVCLTGVCTQDLLPTGDPDTYQAVIDVSTLDPDQMTLSYWVEATNMYQVEAQLGTPANPEILVQATGGGSGKDQPPALPAGLEAVGCEDRLLLSWARSEGVDRLDFFHGAEKNLTTASDVITRSISAGEVIDGGLAGMNAFASGLKTKPQWVSMRAVDREGLASNLTPAIEVQWYDTCEASVRLQARSVERLGDQIKIHWDYQVRAFSHALTNPALPTKGQPIHLNLLEIKDEPLERLHKKEVSQGLWSQYAGTFTETLQSHEVPSGTTLERQLEIRNSSGQVLLKSPTVAFVIQEDWAYEVQDITRPSLGCGPTTERLCTFQVTVENTGSQSWDISDDHFQLNQGARPVSKPWKVKPIEALVIAPGETVVVAVEYQEALTKETDTSITLGWYRGDTQVEGENIVLEAKGEEIRQFKTSISDVTIRESASPGGKWIKGIPGTNTEIEVTGPAIKGIYIDEYKTDRWYPVRYREEGRVYEGFVVATTIRPEWVVWKPYNNRSCLGDLSQTIADRKTKIGLHFGIVDTMSSVWHSGNAKICSTIKATVPFIVGSDGQIWQTLPAYNTTHHITNPKLNRQSIGIEIVNLGSLEKRGDDYGYYGYPNSPKIVEPHRVIKVAEEPTLSRHWQAWVNQNNKINQPEALRTVRNSETTTIESLKKDSCWIKTYMGKSYQNWHNQCWEGYPDEMYEGLNKLVDYLSESFGIPKEFPSFPIWGEKGLDDQALYYRPKYIDGNESSELHYQSFVQYIYSFNGIISHHNSNGKQDTGPHLAISKLINILKSND